MIDQLIGRLGTPQTAKAVWTFYVDDPKHGWVEVSADFAWNRPSHSTTVVVTVTGR